MSQSSDIRTNYRKFINRTAKLGIFVLINGKIGLLNRIFKTFNLKTSNLQ